MAQTVQPIRALVDGLGPLGLVFVVIACVMEVWAVNHGVHCPHCGHPPNPAFWLRYFMVRDGLFLAAFAGGLIALFTASSARRRLLGLGAAAAALFVFGMMPM